MTKITMNLDLITNYYFVTWRPHMMTDGEKRYDVAHLDNSNAKRVKRRNHNRHETSSLLRRSTSRSLQKNADPNLITDARQVKAAVVWRTGRWCQAGSS